MALPLKTIAAFGMSAFILSASPAHSAQTASPNDTARYLAGLPPSAKSPLAPLTQERGWQQHADLLNSTWAGLDQHQLSKVRAWSAQNLTARRPVTYYFFSGPDFLYVDAFFPNASTYILAGLEFTGQLPDVLQLRPRSLATELANLRTSLSTLLRTSYFITSEMGTDLSASQLRGTLPPLYLFLARTGKTIRDVSLVSLAPDGSVQPEFDAKSAARGVKIVFSGGDGKAQTLYYFKTDLSNAGVQNSGFLKFCEQFGAGDIFIKAASYLLHTQKFSTVRDFLLGHGASVVQDDTGIPVKYFQESGWQLQPFGRYVGPIPVFRGHYQTRLKELFAKDDTVPIGFGVGYRWRLNESHVLLAANKNPLSSTPISQPITPPAKTVAAKNTPPAKTAAGKIAPPAPTLAPDASRFPNWHSFLLGGLIGATLMGLWLGRSTTGFRAQP